MSISYWLAPTISFIPAAGPVFSKIFYFLRDEYPAVVQRQIRYRAGVSGRSSLGGALLGLGAHPRAAAVHAPHAGPGRWLSTIERHEMWTQSIVGIAPVASSAIMTNNLTVCFTAFAGGIVFGTRPVYVDVFQRAFARRGRRRPARSMACRSTCGALWPRTARWSCRPSFWPGAAGLRLAHGVCFRGSIAGATQSRWPALKRRRIVAGIIPLLVIAGTLEGFFSPSNAPVWLKFTVGGLLFTLLLMWLFRPLTAGAGRPIETEPSH